MGIVGFLFGLIVGWIGSGYVTGLLPIDICLQKVLFVCVIGPNIIIAVIIAYFVSKMIPI
ncbi:MAG: hypothetical protein HYS80_01605 [Candidatus Aenigmarchaeota archaeon]|nr:hypothetical protein [Candidatus Aenigmarchaeota archaeon]